MHKKLWCTWIIQKPSPPPPPPNQSVEKLSSTKPVFGAQKVRDHSSTHQAWSVILPNVIKSVIWPKMLWFLLFWVFFFFYVILRHQSTIDILILLFLKMHHSLIPIGLFIQNLVQTLSSQFKIFQDVFWWESVVNASVKIKWTCLFIKLRGSLTKARNHTVTTRILERISLKLKIIGVSPD